MNRDELIHRMYEVLDGEAPPRERDELERVLAADPAARAEFEDLKSVFEALGRLPAKFPPEGLVASIMARLPPGPARRSGLRQLFAERRVIGSFTMEGRDSTPARTARLRPTSQFGPIHGGTMSE